MIQLTVTLYNKYMHAYWKGETNFYTESKDTLSQPFWSQAKVNLSKFWILFFTIHVSRCGIRTYFYFAICIFHKEVPHVCTWLSEMVASGTNKTLQTKHVYQLLVMQQRKWSKSTVQCMYLPDMYILTVNKNSIWKISLLIFQVSVIEKNIFINIWQ